jgi:hypothetical protein
MYSFIGDFIPVGGIKKKLPLCAPVTFPTKTTLLELARDNLKIYKRIVDAVTKFATISQRPVDKI